MTESVTKKGKRKYRSTVTETEVEQRQSVDESENENEENKPVRKRNRFSFGTKKKILEDCKVQTHEFIYNKYKVNERTIRRWKESEKKIDEAADNLGSANKKKATNDTKELDDALYLWLLDSIARGTPVSGPILQRKALSLNREIGGPAEFKASNGWLDKWKNRKNVRALMITGEKLAADMEAAPKFKVEFEKITRTKRLTRAQWFNMDETCLQYKAMPKRSLAPLVVKEIQGTKKQMERVTAAACCNADGSCKLPLIVIGTAKKPRALKNFDLEHLPVWYRHQKSGWMDKIIFEEWVIKEFVPRVRAFLTSKNLPLTAALLVDNCKSHVYIKVDDIEVIFLPPNVTSLLQPLDQGILQTFKLHYKRLLVDSILEAQDANVSLVDYLKTISVKNAIFWSAEAWNQVDPWTIYKCWNKIWSIETKDASTQTDDDAATPTLLNSPVGTEISDAAVNKVTNNLLQCINRIEGYNRVNEEILLEWLSNPQEAKERAVWTDREIIDQAKTMSQLSDRGNDFEDDFENNLENDLGNLDASKNETNSGDIDPNFLYNSYQILFQQ